MNLILACLSSPANTSHYAETSAKAEEIWLYTKRVKIGGANNPKNHSTKLPCFSVTKIICGQKPPTHSTNKMHCQLTPIPLNFALHCIAHTKESHAHH